MAKLNPEFQLREEDKNWVQNAYSPTRGMADNDDDMDDDGQYGIKVERLKAAMDELLRTHEHESIDTLYRLIVDRRSLKTGVKTTSALVENLKGIIKI